MKKIKIKKFSEKIEKIGEYLYWYELDSGEQVKFKSKELFRELCRKWVKQDDWLREDQFLHAVYVFETPFTLQLNER